MSWVPRKWCSRQGKKGTLQLMREFSTAVVVSKATVDLQLTPTYWNKRPAANNCSKQLTAANVDVLRAEGHEVVGCTDGVGRDIDTEGDNEQADGAEGRSSSASMRARFTPLAYDDDGIPDDFAICCLRSCSSEDTEQANNCYSSIDLVKIHARVGGEDSLKMQGMTKAWTFCALGVLEYLAKSAMFSPRVA